MKRNINKLLFLLPYLILCSCAAKESNVIETINSENTAKETDSIETTNTISEESSIESKETIKDTTIENNDIFASPSGSDSNLGTIDSPYTFTKAILSVKPGQTIYLLEGTYSSSNPYMINVGNDGEENLYKTIMPYNKAIVCFDFSSMVYSSSNRGITVNGNYWHIKDIEVKGAGDNGIYIGGNYNIIEHCKVHDCSDTGIQLGRSSSSCSSIETWPNNNLIKNCTSYDNHDPSGEDSDGFACKLTTGINNVFDGCIAYNNVDDGWDLYAKGETGAIGAVTIKNCVAFNNGRTTKEIGTSNSDGNGFKLGGESIAVNHKVINSIAFNNLACGFTDNSNPGTISLENCTAFNNGVRDNDANNIDMCRDASTSINNFKNVLSYCTGYLTNPITSTTTIANSKDEYKGSVESSIFYCGLSMLAFKEIQECDYTVESLKGSLLTTSDFPFVSIEIPDKDSDLHSLLRNEDGSVNLHDFLKVKEDTIFASYSIDNKAIGASLNN